MAAFIAEFRLSIIAKQENGDYRSRSVGALRDTLSKLERRFGSEILAGITTVQISAWLDALPVSPRTKQNHRGYSHQVFERALQSGYVRTNPVKGIKPYRDSSRDEAEISILTPTQAATLIERACAETRPLYAIAAFAGVRWAEIARLDWSEIKEDEIIVTAGKAKTRSRRVVTIKPNLKALLAPYRRESGSLLPLSHSNKSNGRHSSRRLISLRQSVQEKADLTPWPTNCLRHSYISYAYALTNDDKYVSAQAGNSSEMVHRNYKALTTKGEAEKYFAI
jgi:integrase